MDMIYWITGLVAGVIFGFGLALRFTVHFVMSSNDLGDYSGTCKDFGDGILLVIEEDEMTTKTHNSHAKEILNHRRELIMERETGSKTGNKTGSATG